MYIPTRPRFGLHWINALFFIGFGAALVWARLPSSSASQLHRLGLTPEGQGYLLIIAGLLIFFTKQLGWHMVLCLALLPYTIASFLLFWENHTAQSMIIISFVQVVTVLIARLNREVYQG